MQLLSRYSTITHVLLGLFICSSAVTGQRLVTANLTAAVTRFSQQLYQQIALNSSTIVFSPFSIHSGLSLTYLGARGQTASELGKALGACGTQRFHDMYKQQIKQLTNIDEVKVRLATFLAVNPRTNLNSSYVDQSRDSYLARVAQFNLSDPAGPEHDINAYLANITELTIQEVLPLGSINKDTSLVLATSLVYSGSWFDQFDAQKTVKDSFTLLNGSTIQVDMMHDIRAGYYWKDDVRGFVTISIPLNYGDFFVILPTRFDGITDLEKNIASYDLQYDIFGNLEYKNIDLSIPKFRVESRFNLKTALTNMGVTKAWSSKDASFAGISGDGGLHFSTVVHAETLELQEQGILAASSNDLPTNIWSLPSGDPADVQFQADHPFLFFVRNYQTNEILLQGKFSG